MESKFNKEEIDYKKLEKEVKFLKNKANKKENLYE